MLKSITKEEFDKYIDYAYDLSQDLTKTAYPIFCDGIKTKEFFIEESLKYTRDYEDILLFMKDDIVEGWIHYFYDKEELSFQTFSFLINNYHKEAMKEYLDFLTINFKGYNTYFGFPLDNTKMIEYLMDCNYTIIEESAVLRYELTSHFVSNNTTDVIKITNENYFIFENLHSLVDYDMWWNTKRIKSDLDNWNIYAYKKDDIVKGVIYFKDYGNMVEPFGVDYINNNYDSEVFTILFNVAFSYMKKNNVKYLIYFAEIYEVENALKNDFKLLTKYICFDIKI